MSAPEECAVCTRHGVDVCPGMGAAPSVDMAIVEITATDLPRVLDALAHHADVLTVTRMDTSAPETVIDMDVDDYVEVVHGHETHRLTPDLHTPDCTPGCWQ